MCAWLGQTLGIWSLVASKMCACLCHMDVMWMAAKIGQLRTTHTSLTSQIQTTHVENESLGRASCYDHRLVNCYLCSPLLLPWPWQLTYSPGLPCDYLCLPTALLICLLMLCHAYWYYQAWVSILTVHLVILTYPAYWSLAMTHAPMGCTIYIGLTVTCTSRPDLVTFRSIKV
jgi:hypothetical protein